MPKGDRDILKADPEDGTTPIANLLLEAMAIAKLTGKEKGIILYLCRRTYGWVSNQSRLKEAQLTLSEWAKVLQSDTPKASSLLSGLVKKGILKRQFIGPGKSYIYSINTRVAEWDKGCLNQQLLSEIGRQPLPKTTRQPLPKTTTPSDTNLVSGKERLNKYKESTTTSTEQQRVEFSEFIEELRPQYPDVKFDNELQKFRLYWSEGRRKLERPKLALKNWMDKAREFKQDGKGGTHRSGHYRGAKRSDDPDKYIKGSKGHMVNR